MEDYRKILAKPYLLQLLIKLEISFQHETMTMLWEVGFSVNSNLCKVTCILEHMLGREGECPPYNFACVHVFTRLCTCACVYMTVHVCMCLHDCARVHVFT